MRETLNRLTAAWLGVVVRHPVLVLLTAVALAVASILYAVNTLGMNTNTSAMVAQDSPFRVAEDAYWEVFPEKNNNILVVLQGPDALSLEAATEAIAEALAREPASFSDVYAPGTGPFFKRNGLLYLSEDDLSDTVDRLAEAQAAMGVLAQDPSLRGLLSAFEAALQAEDAGEAVPEALTAAMDRLTEAANAVARDEAVNVRLLSDLNTQQNGNGLRVIIVRLVPDFTAVLAAEAGILRFHAILDDLRDRGLVAPDVQVRLTGEDVLGYEELLSAEASVAAAGLISLVLLAIILAWGLRSGRLIIGCYMTLAVGFCWTLAFAALTVGELNILSVSFAVLFIGLGIDHAIHVSLRYVEARAAGEDPLTGLVTTGRSLGGALALAALTSGIGFAAFVPTAYVGFADLGLIAAGGMVMAWLAALTFLPAALAIIGLPKRAIRPMTLPGGLQRPSRALAWSIMGLAVLALPLLFGARFDFSTLAIKDPDMESVKALADLERDGTNSDYSAFVMTDDIDAARDLAARLDALPEVDSAITTASYVPENQDEKLAIIEEAAFFLWPALNPQAVKPLPNDAERLAAVRAFLREGGGNAAVKPETIDHLVPLQDALSNLLATDDPANALQRLEAALLPDVTAQLARIGQSLEAEPVTFDDLPAELVDWDTGPDGQSIITVIPAGDMGDHDQLEAFADAVVTVAPQAVGRPVAEVATGRIVVESFLTASVLALLAITALLFLIFRRISDVLLVLLPLGVAFSLTVGISVLLGMPFNFANVIVLPLLLGFGVDSGIHLVARRQQRGDADGVMGSSTPRAVLISALTTIASFGSLSLSPHVGIASLGLLLTIGMALIIIAVVVVLPELMRLRDRKIGER